MGQLLRQVGPFPDLKATNTAESHFHALARTIIYQQLAGNAAATIHDRVRALTPGRRFPRAEELARLPWPSTLETLDLSYTSLTQRGARALTSTSSGLPRSVDLHLPSSHS